VWTFSTLSAIGPDLISPAPLLTTLAVQAGEIVTAPLKLMAQSFAGCQALNGPMLCTASSSSDLSHTLKFTSIAFQDSNGKNLSGDGISSPNFDGSGLVVGGGLPPVPGPGTGLL
jgi:hypothetical protein